MPLTDVATGEVVGHINAMASDITIRAVARGIDPALLNDVVDQALDVFSVVNVACTRFDPTSPLMKANSRPDNWVRVPRVCFRAVREAYHAYLVTAGRFDPRVLSDLVRLGYARSMRDGVPEDIDAPDALATRPALPEWRPAFRADESAVRLGGTPIDLGGIGKGLAVRWCSDRLAKAVDDFLVEAGGDCYCAGHAPEGGPWRIAVEDPFGASRPVVVLQLSDRACATSSVRIRQWNASGRHVHHLVDPRNGLPGGEGLQSVTVVERDPATAEVWSKTLFLCGRAGIAEEAQHKRIAAVWVDVDGALSMSPAMAPYVIWQAT